MPSQFDIIQVLNTRVGTNSQALVFKVRWTDNHQIAFMHFEMAKKKYPHIVLDYLASKIKQKPVYSTQSKDMSSPMTANTQTFIIDDCQEKKQSTKIQKFFKGFSNQQQSKEYIKIFDCDSVIPIDSNLAYPVFFKLSLTRTRKSIRKFQKRNVSTGKIQSEQ